MNMKARIGSALRRSRNRLGPSRYQNTELIAYRCFSRAIDRLTPIDSVGSSLAKALVIEPGQYTVEGLCFNLQADGVYRFYRLGSFSAQRLVCRADADTFLQCGGYLWSYGFDDDKTSPLDHPRLASLGRVVLSCGHLAALCVRTCEAVGLHAREVGTLTLASRNGQDDGHTLVELLTDAGWIAYDPSFNVCFRQGRRRLSIAAVCGAVRENQRLDLEELPGNLGHGSARVNGRDYSFWIDERTLSRAALLSWYHRVAMLPLVRCGQRYNYPLIDVIRSRVEELRELNYAPLQPMKFEGRYYGHSRST